jgi:hypothetical protein
LSPDGGPRRQVVEGSRGARLLEMDTWSVLLDVAGQGRGLVPKHAIDGYLLGATG